MRSTHTEIGWPEVSKDALCYVFTPICANDPGTVIVDQPSRMVHFYNCHRPQQFLPVSKDEMKKWFSCSVDELQWAYSFGDNTPDGECLHVHTTSGKAIITNRLGLVTEDGYEEIRDIIKELAPIRNLKAETEFIQPMAILFGAFAGFFAGWNLLPSDGDATYYIMGGIVLGAASAFLLVWFAGRVLRINLGLPMTFSLFGGASGFFLGECVPVDGFAAAAIGAVAGGILGFLAMAKTNPTIGVGEEKEVSPP